MKHCKQSALQEVDHTCCCLLFDVRSAHCIPLPLKIWRRSKIWQQKLRKPRFRASTETTKLLNMSNNVTCHHNSHLLAPKIHTIKLDQYQVNLKTVLLPNASTATKLVWNRDGMSRTAHLHSQMYLVHQNLTLVSSWMHHCPQTWQYFRPWMCVRSMASEDKFTRFTRWGMVWTHAPRFNGSMPTLQLDLIRTEPHENFPCAFH